MAMYRPHRPGMRPDGIGRCGSLMASTCRSNQSFTAWLVAHTKGPAKAIPMAASNHFPSIATPEATRPQATAHIGGNQVIGLNNSVTAESCGRVIECVFTHDTYRCQVKFTQTMVYTKDAVGKAPGRKCERLSLRLDVWHADTKTTQLHVQALT